MHALQPNPLVRAFDFDLVTLKICETIDTYNKPMEKRSTIPTFLLIGICNFQTALAGSIRMVISEMILNKQVMKTTVSLSRHRASVMSGPQIASRGEQAKMEMKVLIV